MTNLLTKIESKVKPPPTKTEVIEAMTRLRVKQLEDEAEASARIKQKIEDELKPMILAHALEVFSICPKTIRHGSRKTRWDSEKRKTVYLNDVAGVEVRLEFKSLPKDLTRTLVEYHKITSWRKNFDVKEIRREIKERMDNLTPKSTRVEALLTDPASKQALGSMMKAIFKPALPVSETH